MMSVPWQTATARSALLITGWDGKMTPEYLRQLAKGLSTCEQGELQMALEGSADEIERLRLNHEIADRMGWRPDVMGRKIAKLEDEIERLQHLLDEFKKRLSDRTAEAMRLHKIIAR
jgi:dynactin complex subunit